MHYYKLLIPLMHTAELIGIYIYIYIYIYIFIIFINNSRRKDKGNQWHDGGCISDTTRPLMFYILHIYIYIYNYIYILPMTRIHLLKTKMKFFHYIIGLSSL